MKTSIRIFCIAAAMLLLLTGCSLTSFSEPGTKTVATDSSKYITAFENNWQYHYLDSQAKECYGTLYTVLTDTVDRDSQVTVADNNGQKKTRIGVKVSLPHPIRDQKEATVLYNAFFRDNPQFFYVDSVYSLEGYMRNGEALYDTLVLVYTMPADERQTALQKAEEALDSMRKGRPDTRDPFDTELFLHDRLAQHCTYDHQAAEKGHTAFPHAFTAYGALVEGKAVCEGYARAMQWLLKESGIPATLVTGQSIQTKEDHMWNMVHINGRNYHLDVTWDDSEETVRHTYFNLSDDMLKDTHTLTTHQPGLPACTDQADNFFVKKGRWITTYERTQIARCIAAAVADGETTIEIRFQKDKFDNALLFLKNRPLTASMVEPYLPPDKKPFWEYTLLGDSERQILILEKK